jgi:gamma-glutamyltranspeptidase/glutathione hydrolase
MASDNNARSQFGMRCAIVSGHHLATRAAESMLGQGGSLIDAMIAASAVLTVALPHTSSLGGCGMLLYFDAGSGTVHALNGSGRAPLAAEPAAFGQALPQRGARAAVTPTLVRLWARAHERFGRLPWHGLFGPAIEHAAFGIGCSEELARNLRAAAPEVALQPGFQATFVHDGVPMRAGELFRQPLIAAVLERIARDGEDGFYRGAVARSLVDFSVQAGGFLGQDDLDRAAADWTEAWQAAYAGHRIHVMPPNSVGVLMLRQLEIDQYRREIGAAGGAAGGGEKLVDQIRTAAATIALFKDRIGDPNRRLLQPADFGIGQPASAETASPMPPRHSHQAGDTTGFVAVDQEGNAVSMLQSVFQPFGSGCVDPGTGVLFNNRLFDFSLTPGTANFLTPGSRPSHTLNPYLVTDGAGVRMAGLSPGGVSQTTTCFQMITAAFGGLATLGEIVSRPRWSLGRDGTVLLEPGMPDGVAAALRSGGFSVVENSSHEFYFGSAKLVRITAQGMREAAADQRRQAHAAAW